MTARPLVGGTATPAEITLDGAQVRQLWRELNTLPYGALVSMSPSRVTTSEELLAYLTGLRVVLERVAHRATETERKLHELESDVEAFRRVLGTVQ